ncbi:MAG: ATP-binding protein [Coprobacillus sp.]|nr:ATP-binding protein [Coprobacillus sp.]
MILSVTINNYKAINNRVSLSLEGDKHTKRLEDNIYSGETGFSILKSVGIFGPNNVGKSCLVECLSILKRILNGHSIVIPPDMFSSEKKITELGISFLYNEKVYSYKCLYDTSPFSNSSQIGFIYEKLSIVEKGSEKREKETTLFMIDTVKDKYIFKGSAKVASLLKASSRERSALFSLNKNVSSEVSLYQDICKGFSDSLEIFRGEYIPLSKTVEIFKENKEEARLLKALIVAADLGIDDFGYMEGEMGPTSLAKSPLGEETSLNRSDEAYRLYSTKSDDLSRKRVPFLSVDSTGTRKVIALLGYIVDALKNDKIVVIDELGNSLHIGLCTAIISMFNSELNHKGQLIFTSHDTALLDTSILFRKDQIWFLSREEGKEYLYSLSDFNARGDGARPASNNAEKYRLGEFGAIPKINIYTALSELEALRPDSVQQAEESDE